MFTVHIRLSNNTYNDRHDIAEKLLAQGVKQQSITHSLEIIICICLINLLQEQNMAKCYN
jgi:hypothetical protein